MLKKAELGKTIFDLANDWNGWTAEDAETVRKKAGISTDKVRAITEVLVDYIIADEEKQKLHNAISDEDIFVLAGEDGRKLFDARCNTLRGFGKNAGEFVVNEYKALIPNIRGTEIKKGADFFIKQMSGFAEGNLELALVNGYNTLKPQLNDADKKEHIIALRTIILNTYKCYISTPSITRLYVNLLGELKGKEAAEEAAALRNAMRSGLSDSQRGNAAYVYRGLVSALDTDEIKAAATTLTALMAVDDDSEFQVRAAVGTYAGLADKLDDAREISSGAIALREVMANYDAEIAHMAAYAYKVLSKNIAGETAKREAADLKAMLNYPSSRNKKEVEKAYKSLVDAMKLEETKQRISAIRIMMAKGFGDEYKYLALVSKLERIDLMKELTELRLLMAPTTYNHGVNKVVTRAYASLVRMLDRFEVLGEAAELRALMNGKNPIALSNFLEAYSILIPRIEGENAESEASHIIGLISTADEYRIIPITELHLKLVGNIKDESTKEESIKDLAVALRTLIVQGAPEIKKAAVESYCYVVERLRPEDVRSEAAELRKLMDDVDVNIKLAAITAHAVLSEQIDGEDVKKGAESIRKRMEDPELSTIKTALWAYNCLAPKIDHEEAVAVAAVLDRLMNNKDRTIRSRARELRKTLPL